MEKPETPKGKRNAVAGLKIVYLLALCVGIFFTKNLYVLSGLVAAHLALYFALRLPLRPLFKMFAKLIPLVVLISIGYTIFPPNVERGFFEVSPDLRGFLFGVAILLRVFVIVSASLLVRKSGSPREFIDGLTFIRLPRFLIMTLDVTFFLLEGGTEHGPGEDRPGREKVPGGRKKRNKIEIRARDLIRGRLGVIFDAFAAAVEDAREHVKKQDYYTGEKYQLDIPVIAAFAVVLTLLRMIKFGSGMHLGMGSKVLVIFPIYFVCKMITSGRLSGSMLGLTAGGIAFFLGLGKHGPLNLPERIIPGISLDLMYPFVSRFTSLLPAVTGENDAKTKKLKYTAAYVALVLCAIVFALVKWGASFVKPLFQERPDEGWFLFFLEGPVSILWGVLTGTGLFIALFASKRIRRLIKEHQDLDEESPDSPADSGDSGSGEIVDSGE